MPNLICIMGFLEKTAQTVLKSWPWCFSLFTFDILLNTERKPNFDIDIVKLNVKRGHFYFFYWLHIGLNSMRHRRIHWWETRLLWVKFNFADLYLWHGFSGLPLCSLDAEFGQPEQRFVTCERTCRVIILFWLLQGTGDCVGEREKRDSQICPRLLTWTWRHL